MNEVAPLAVSETLEFSEAYRYGNYFYIATLKDGRDVGFCADKISVTNNGELIALGTSVLSKDGKSRQESADPRVNLCLAPGQWISVYAASAINGDPVAIDWIEGTSSKSE